MNDWPNLVQPFDGILFSYKNIIQLKNIDTTTWMNLGDLMLSEKSQIQKAT